jgi:uncharacterized protein YjiK
MRVITDKTFGGEDGMVRIWNQTAGLVQVTPDGHLLGAHQSAWVDDNETVQHLIEINHVVVTAGTSKKTAKKNTKAKAKPIDQPQKDTSEVLPVVLEQDPEVTQVNETQQETATTDNTAILDSFVLDSSPIADNTESVSVENI